MSTAEPLDVIVRAGRPGDAAAIARVHVETWRATYAGLVPDAYLVRMTEAGQAFQWQRALSRARGLEDVVVAEHGAGGVVGFGSCGAGRGRGLAFEAEIYTLYVLGDHQDRGIGRRLLTALFERCTARGRGSAMLWVLSGNPSRYFYEAMGGQAVASQEEPFAGTVLSETAYGWPNLERWLAENTISGEERP